MINLTQCRLGRGLQVRTKWHLDPSPTFIYPPKATAPYRVLIFFHFCHKSLSPRRRPTSPEPRMQPTQNRCYPSPGGATTFSKLGGPIPWSRLLYRTKYGWYTQFRALQSVT